MLAAAFFVIIGLMGTIKRSERPLQNDKTVELPLPAPVERAIAKLGHDIALARRRRSISQQSLAWRIGASESTVRRMEKGDVRIPLQYLARALFVFGELERFARLLDTSQDDIGLSLMDDKLPKRIRAKTRTPGSAAL